jgi:hypothetical protein
MSAPTCGEINVHSSLDEQAACAHFLGKDIEEAEALFRENALYFQEDLLWMGLSAFLYYAEAAIRYIESPAAYGDSDIVRCWTAILEFRRDVDGIEALSPIGRRLAESLDFILANWRRFEIYEDDQPDLDGRIKALSNAIRLL